MLTRATLRTLAELRLAEAQLLLERGFFSGAYYLAGYAAELGLKALIATKFAAHEIPDRDFVNRVYTHDIEKLIDHAGLKPEFDQRVKNDFPFRTNWETVKNWNEGSRYEENQEKAARELVPTIGER